MENRLTNGLSLSNKTTELEEEAKGSGSSFALTSPAVYSLKWLMTSFLILFMDHSAFPNFLLFNVNKKNKQKKICTVRRYKYFAYSALVRPKFSSNLDGQDLCVDLFFLQE